MGHKFEPCTTRHMSKWRNWQTRWSKEPVFAGSIPALDTNGNFIVANMLLTDDSLLVASGGQ